MKEIKEKFIKELEGSIESSIDSISSKIISEALSQNSNSKLKDIILTFNTQDSGAIQAKTDLINGYLEAIIVDTEAPIQLKISLTEFPEIILLDTKSSDIHGQIIIPLGVQNITDDYKGWTFSNKNWPLNNKLNIDIKGPKQTKIKMVIRYA